MYLLTNHLLSWGQIYNIIIYNHLIYKKNKIFLWILFIKERFRENKEIDEIEHLVQAYEFAQNNRLTRQHLLTCHRIFSETLLIKSKRGTYRQEQVGVFGKAGIAYLAVEPEFVKKEMSQFFSDVTELLNDSLIVEEVFYFASLIHLIFAHIHPFRDGNGRAARLLEKWFIAEKLGVNYYELNYDRCIDFLQMLPNCLN